MSFEQLEFRLQDSVATLTLDDPAALNALSRPMLRGFNAALDQIEDPANAVRCVLLTGAGRAFCAGAHQIANDPADLLDDDGQPDLGKPLEEEYHPLLERLRDLHCPLITAVNGPAAGAGMSFALMGDLVLAARSAYFLQAFRRIGLMPDCGATFLLPRLVGWGRALELSLLGERLPAERALEWGLVNRVFDDDQLMPEALKLAGELAQGPTLALGLIRKAYWESVDNGYLEQLEVERDLQRLAGRSKDFLEGVAAFREKRPARFQGE
jgi:2-(1,2-epoxy-1,2-dihydrophenyl)acetyl-CoA isomerase